MPHLYLLMTATSIGLPLSRSAQLPIPTCIMMNITGLVSEHVQRIKATEDDLSESYEQRKCSRVNQTILFNLTLEVYTI